MRRDVSTMSWAEFLEEFNQKYYDPASLRQQQKEFSELTQGNMSVSEVCRKFDQLSRLCPYVVPTEREKIQKMIGMFRPETTALVDTGLVPPTSVADCVSRAIRVEFHVARQKEEREKHWEAKKKERALAKSTQVGQSSKPSQNAKPSQGNNQGSQ